MATRSSVHRGAIGRPATVWSKNETGRETVGRTSFEGIPMPSGLTLPADDVPILRAAIGMGASHLLTGDLRHFGALMGTRVSGVLVRRPAAYLGHHRS